MVPLMLVSLPAGVLADRVEQAVGDPGDEVARAGADDRRRRPVLYAAHRGPPGRLAVLVLLGVQAALFSPAKYGILPEILPHERLSAGNGLLEMWSNLAIIAGMVAGGVLLSLTGGRPWLGGLVLVGLLGRGPGRRVRRSRGSRPRGPRGGWRDASGSPGRRSGPIGSCGWRSPASSSSGRSPA